MAAIDPALLGSYASSLFAILLALYNFYKARESAKLELSPPIEIGTLDRNLFGKQFFYFPLYLSNAGSRPANLEWIDLYFEDVETNEKFPFYLTKNVEGRKLSEIKSILPLFPILIEGYNSISVIMEFTEGKKKKLPPNRNYRAMFTLTYNENKTLTVPVSYEFKPSQEIGGIQNIQWSPLRERINDPSDFPGITLFGKDVSS
ncbi:MAG: hypothetical protein ACW99F_05840 [Candidatus Hodarchaeales archaeon]|jgi:hypothetical protein